MGLTNVQKCAVVVSMWLFLAAMSIKMAAADGEDSVLTHQFYKANLCDLDDRVNSLCSEVLPASRGLLDCVALCAARDPCAGISMDTNKNCFIHRKCPHVTGCTVPAIQHDHWVKQRCANGGDYDESTQSCRCVDSWVGKTCSEHPKDCAELITHGYPEGQHSAVLDPDKDGKNLIPVSCYVTPSGGYHSVFVLSHSGHSHFNLSWDEHRAGFHNGSVLWIGLDRWHAVAAIGYTRLFIFLSFGDEGILYREYHQFVLEGSQGGFSYSHNRDWENGKGRVMRAGNKVSDCLGPYQKTNFSSWDRDNDQVLWENCASSTGVGWWFQQDCLMTCNLFGRVDGGGAGLIVPGVDLTTWQSHLKQVLVYLEPQ